MTVEAAALALRVEEQGAEQVEAKLDRVDKKAAKLGSKPIELKFTAPTIERIDNQLDQLGKQATLYSQGTKFASTRTGALQELAMVEKDLRNIIGSSITPLEQRIKAEQTLANVVSARTGGGKSLLAMAGSALGTLGIAVTAGAVVHEFISMTKGAIDAGDAMHDMAMRTGISAENLSVFQAVADNSGASMETFAIGARKLSKEIEGAKNGNKEAISAFAKLGITVDDLKGKSLDQVFLMISDAQERMQDGSEKNAIMLQLLGRSGDALIPTMHDLANGGFGRTKEKLEELNAVISTDFANKADAFNDKIGDLGKATRGLGMSIAELLLPKMTSFVEWMTKGTTETSKFVNVLFLLSNMKDDSLGAMFQKLKAVAQMASGDVAGALTTVLTNQVASFGDIKAGSSSTATPKKPVDPAELERAEKARIQAIDEQIAALGQLASAHKLTGQDIGTAIALEMALQKEYDRTSTSLKRRGEITKELGDLTKVLPQAFTLKDIRSITDTEHDPRLVGVDPLTGKMKSPFAGMGKAPFDPLKSEGGQLAGRALEQLLSLQGGNAAAALDVAYAKIQQYVANKEPIPIDVAIQLNDLAKATADVEEQFQTFLPRVGQSFFESLGTGIGTGVGNGKDMLLGALGGIFSSMGRALVSYGIAMSGLLPHLLNPFTSGPAAIVAGTLLIALGAKLGSMASGGGGGGGGGGSGSTGPNRPPKKEEDDAFAVAFDPDAKLRQSRAVVAPGVKSLGNKALPDSRPVVQIGTINSLSPDHGEWQRAVADTYMNARDRGLIKDNG